jgi:hypothetical protein
MPQPQTVLFVNSATAEALQQLSRITPSDLDTPIAARPFHSWEEVERSGVTKEGYKALQRQGAKLGEPSDDPIGELGSGGSGGSAAGNLGQA